MIWPITGCSVGVGRALAVAAAARCDRMVASARSAAALDDLLDRYPDTVQAISLDVTRLGDACPSRPTSRMQADDRS